MYERFLALTPGGSCRAVEFKKAGWVSTGDHPELYFFVVDNHEDVVVGLSGSALEAFQKSHRYLSREEKIDVAGLHLKRQMEAGRLLRAENLYVDASELAGLLRELGIAS